MRRPEDDDKTLSLSSIQLEVNISAAEPVGGKPSPVQEETSELLTNSDVVQEIANSPVDLTGCLSATGKFKLIKSSGESLNENF